MTSSVTILLGLDCDRPRTRFRAHDKYVSELSEVIEYLSELDERWSQANVTWTMFLCGQFVEAVAAVTGFDEVRRLLGVTNTRCEIACHTYAHDPIGPVAGRKDLVPIGPTRLAEDLRHNTEVLEWLTGEVGSSFGFRAPYGYTASDLPDAAVQEIARCRSYSSSLLRGRHHPVCPPLIEGVVRQPFLNHYGLWEIPSHGWHDTVFAGLSLSPGHPPPHVKACDYYCDLVREATTVSKETEKPIYLGLVLHPLAMARYDPSFALVDRLLQIMDSNDIRTYGEAVQGMKAGAVTDRAAAPGNIDVP